MGWSNISEVFLQFHHRKIYEPTILGSIPFMGEKRRTRGSTWQMWRFNGQGLRPMVADRIKCMTRFVTQMETTRDEVVNI
jgi:glyceraldehyde-3-phosphate dehydrogenase (NADP+)